MEYSNLSSLSKRTGIEKGQLQYCLYHELIPERDWLLPEETADGRLDYVTAVCVAGAAALLRTGCRPETIKRFLYEVARLHPKGRNPLGLPLIAQAIQGKVRSTILMADNTHVRCKIGTADSGWISVAGPTHEPDLEFEPCAVMALDIGIIRDLVRG